MATERGRKFCKSSPPNKFLDPLLYVPVIKICKYTSYNRFVYRPFQIRKNIQTLLNWTERNSLDETVSARRDLTRHCSEVSVAAFTWVLLKYPEHWPCGGFVNLHCSAHYLPRAILQPGWQPPWYSCQGAWKKAERKRRGSILVEKSDF